MRTRLSRAGALYLTNGGESMNIAIDIDDTLTDSFEYFQPFVAEFFGADICELQERNISYSNLPAEWRERELDFCRAYYDRVVADTPFKPYAAEGIRALKAAGHRIIIITGRTVAFYTDPYNTTSLELKNGDICYDRLICTLDKGKACLDEKIDLLIDDMPKNCDAAAALGIGTLLFESRANLGEDVRHTRVSSWRAVVDLINNAE